MSDARLRANSTFDGLHAGEQFVGDYDQWKLYIDRGFVSVVEMDYQSAVDRVKLGAPRTTEDDEAIEVPVGETGALGDDDVADAEIVDEAEATPEPA